MRLIDKDWLLRMLNFFNYREHRDLRFLGGIRAASEIIKDAETVELIRCKDCRYHRVYTFKNGETDSYCDYFSGFWSKYEVEDDDYCSNAERYEVEDDDYCSRAERRDEEK